jgi:hypothetical protein
MDMTPPASYEATTGNNGTWVTSKTDMTTQYYNDLFDLFRMDYGLGALKAR